MTRFICIIGAGLPAALTGLCLLASAPARSAAPGLDSISVTASAVDVDISGNVYLLDSERGMLSILGPSGAPIASMGGMGWENTKFDNPRGLWARNGIDVFVADYGNHRVQRFDRRLNYISTLFTRDNDVPEERFGYPTDVGVSRLGDLFVCDGENQRLIRIGRDGTTIRSMGDYTAGKGRLVAPTRVDVGAHDRVYVVDGKRVVVLDLFGNYLHDLPLGAAPVAFWADDEGVLAADGRRLYAFDAEERPGGVVDLEPWLGGRPVLAVAAGRGNLYLLVHGVLLIRPDPRIVQ
jgi:DNA-binding beta-propeller fold protein YncE